MTEPGDPLPQKGRTALSVCIGHAVRRRRMLLQMFQVDFAKETGLSRSGVDLLERGRRVPKLDTLEQVCRVCGIWVMELMAEAERLSRN